MTTKFIVSAVVLGVCVIGGVSTVVSGDDRGPNRFQLRLIGFQENPSVSTIGNGRLNVAIDEDAEQITYRLRYSDLEGGTVLFAHIHLGALHTNGGVVAFLCGGGGKPACPQPDGEIEGVIEPADIVGPAAQGINPGEETAFAEFVKAIRAGYTYANVHTTRWPGGEIRDQVGDHGGHGDHD
jgi:CHRD domain-containing protein